MKRVAVIGSGFAGYGAIVALLRMKDVEIHLIDIGLTNRLAGHSERLLRLPLWVGLMPEMNFLLPKMLTHFK